MIKSRFSDKKLYPWPGLQGSVAFFPQILAWALWPSGAQPQGHSGVKGINCCGGKRAGKRYQDCPDRGNLMGKGNQTRTAF
ncbi:hypothetical protein BST81_17500 [Leptolyngbya sp. 'hensonii']|uniref:hypothetical protein n=1 Tax=Leptolyngbya sp. 'hensonii' TaxID=1922337 RepID=UPI00094FA93B|nr:hypothetical protein [Leptolyngbya sp. 'hensonii']OLP17146.1 hypothetical protein BST81_17500 [Leptolyngbya sp. 'hensonii']